MPTYSYKCNECGKTFDVFQSITAEPLKVCQCGKEGSVKRLIGGGAGFIFKGSGFYTTDYRSKNYQEKAKSEAESAKPSESKSSGSEGSSASSSSEKSSNNGDKKSA